MEITIPDINYLVLQKVNEYNLQNEERLSVCVDSKYFSTNDVMRCATLQISSTQIKFGSIEYTLISGPFKRSEVQDKILAIRTGKNNDVLIEFEKEGFEDLLYVMQSNRIEEYENDPYYNRRKGKK